MKVLSGIYFLLSHLIISEVKSVSNSRSSCRTGIHILTVALFTLLFTSCEKDISIDLPKPDEKLVVEGKIETGQFPYIILTKNSPYYETFYTKDLEKYFVHGATVIVSEISNGIVTKTDTLSELTLDTLGVKVSAYISLNIKGVVGNTYTLNIITDSQNISSTTTIPPSYPLDSVWVKYDEDKSNPDLVRLICRYTDPPALGQNARYFTKRNSEPFYPGLNSVYDDAVINGTTFDFPLDRGINRNAEDSFKDYGYFFKGDTVEVKWCNIDRATFNFCRTMEFELGSQGNPFAAPIKIQSNIKGGLGIWAGYSASFKKIIIPK